MGDLPVLKPYKIVTFVEALGFNEIRLKRKYESRQLHT